MIDVQREERKDAIGTLASRGVDVRGLAVVVGGIYKNRIISISLLPLGLLVYENEGACEITCSRPIQPPIIRF